MKSDDKKLAPLVREINELGGILCTQISDGNRGLKIMPRP